MKLVLPFHWSTFAPVNLFMHRPSHIPLQRRIFPSGHRSCRARLLGPALGPGNDKTPCEANILKKKSKVMWIRMRFTWLCYITSNKASVTLQLACIRSNSAFTFPHLSPCMSEQNIYPPPGLRVNGLLLAPVRHLWHESPVQCRVASADSPEPHSTVALDTGLGDEPESAPYDHVWGLQPWPPKRDGMGVILQHSNPYAWFQDNTWFNQCKWSVYTVFSCPLIKHIKPSQIHRVSEKERES